MGSRGQNAMLLFLACLHLSPSSAFSWSSSACSYSLSFAPSIQKTLFSRGNRNHVTKYAMQQVNHGNDRNQQDLVLLLRNFRNGVHQENENKIVFDAQLSSKDRAFLHEVCERLGLGHESFGQKEERRLSVWRMQTQRRLENMENAIRVEKMTARKQWEEAMATSETNEMEAAGFLLLNARIESVDVTDFGRFKWTLTEDPSRRGHLTRFNVKMGSPVVLAERSKSGKWQASQASGSFGFVVNNRRGSLDAIFEVHPDQVLDPTDKTDSISLLASPDSVTYDRLLQGLRKCLSVAGDSKQVLDMMFEKVVHDAEDHIPSSELAQLDFFDTELNPEQRLAVAQCCFRQKHTSSPIRLIHGPFGTGKTKTLVEIIRQRLKLDQRILVCAASNAAVDNLAIGLLQADVSPNLPLARAGIPERVDAHLADVTLAALQKKQPSAALSKSLFQQANEELRVSEKWRRGDDGAAIRREARKESRELFRDARRLQKEVTPISFLLEMTCSEGGQYNIAKSKSLMWDSYWLHVSVARGIGYFGFLPSVCLFGLKSKDDDVILFDAVIIDEASQVLSSPTYLSSNQHEQALTAAVLQTLPYIKNQTKSTMQSSLPRMILAGDHRQLPPTVLTEDRDARNLLQSTIFEASVLKHDFKN
eukprot:305729-Hanusia_phi.AAC.3